MMKRYSHLLLWMPLAAACFFCACQKGFLDKRPDKALLDSSYPFGVALSERRRAALLDAARGLRIPVIALENDREIWHSTPLPPLITKAEDGGVIYSGVITRMVSPSESLSFVVGPNDFIRELEKVKLIHKAEADVPDQVAMFHYIGADEFAGCVKRTAALYKKRMEGIKKVFERRLSGKATLLGPDAGLCFWLCFGTPLNPSLAGELALQSGFSGINDFRVLDESVPLKGLCCGFGQHDLPCWRGFFEGLEKLLC